ncbi:serine/threonine-protein kinase [Frankia sp. Mgl5]|uniref:serine/threonine-protein kinase n=1 Tax=Frankia sp. Mgl5 TaxID=2933793 RepID=UPI00200D299A|nr:serine/threonine-protein kinase [Frankia sp. Mgl5]
MAAGDQFAGFHIERVLGRGSFGTVYRAAERQLDSERTVALKVIDPADSVADDRALRRDRFLREVRALGAGHHPHIVPVYRVGELDGLLFLAMPLLPGDLDNEIERRGTFSPTIAGQVVGQVATALHSAHVHGIVHRDVKPANVLFFTDINGQPHAYLADFGLAALVDGDRLTRDGALLGTVQYMAPEQLRGEPATAASDIYAAGLILHEMLVGCPQCPTGTCPGTTSTDPLTAGLHIIALHACAADPADRHPSARALSRDLAAALGTTPLPDGPGPTMPGGRERTTTAPSPSGISFDPTGSDQKLDPAPSLDYPAAASANTSPTAGAEVPPRTDNLDGSDVLLRADDPDGSTTRSQSTADPPPPPASGRPARQVVLAASVAAAVVLALAGLLAARPSWSPYRLSSQAEGRAARSLPAGPASVTPSPGRLTIGADDGPPLDAPARKERSAQASSPTPSAGPAIESSDPAPGPSLRPAPEASAEPPSHPPTGAAPTPTSTSGGSTTRLVVCGETATVRDSYLAGSQPVGPALVRGDVFDSDGLTGGNGWVHGTAPAKGLTGWVLRKYVKTVCLSG